MNVDNTIPNQQERLKNVRRLEAAAKLLSADDFAIFEKTLQNLEAAHEKLFTPSNHVMHTTNSHYFDKILASGSLATGDEKEGMYNSKGVSFTDGDFTEAITFQTIYDDQNSRSEDKQINSEKYQSKVRGFIEFFWNDPTRREELKNYFAEIAGETEINNIEDAIRIAEKFKFKSTPKELEDKPDQLNDLYGVTIVYEQSSIPDLTQEGTSGLQRYFELRSYQKNGIPLKNAAYIFVPASRVVEVTTKLEQRGLSDIHVRASEELEALRIIQLAANP